MGMFMLLFYGIYIAVAVGIFYIFKQVPSKLVRAIVLAILILIPTYDIIITNVLGAYYCHAEPNPKTFIKKKVEYPISIYWEDNVYPGFSDVFRDEYSKTKYNDITLMIKRYLDGVHIKTIALNTKDGKIKVFKATLDDWKNSREIAKNEEKNRKKIKTENGTWITLYSQAYYDARDEDAKKIADRGVVCDKSKMPPMNYTVTFDEVKLNSFSRKFLYSDETKVIDNKTGEIIAYNRRYMHFFYHIIPDFALGNRYYVYKPICGANYLHYGRDDFSYIGYYGSVEHAIDINVKLYNKYIKGEKRLIGTGYF